MKQPNCKNRLWWKKTIFLFLIIWDLINKLMLRIYLKSRNFVCSLRKDGITTIFCKFKKIFNNILKFLKNTIPGCIWKRKKKWSMNNKNLKRNLKKNLPIEKTRSINKQSNNRKTKRMKKKVRKMRKIRNRKRKKRKK